MVAIENAATSLVLERGFDAVTVDEICAAAEISKRTFFNYVPSTEAAVIGLTPEEVPDDDRTAFLKTADPDVPHALLRLLLAAFAAAAALPGLSDGVGVTLIGWLMRMGFLATSPAIGAVATGAGLSVALGILVILGVVVMACAPALRERA